QALAAAEQAYFEARRAQAAADYGCPWEYRFTNRELDKLGSAAERVSTLRDDLGLIINLRERIDCECELEQVEYRLKVMRIRWWERKEKRKLVETAINTRRKLSTVKTIDIEGTTYVCTGRHRTNPETGERIEILKRVEPVS